MYTSHYLSPVGDLTMAGTESNLTALYFSAQKHIPVVLDDLIERETEVFTKTKLYLDSYFEGKRPSLLPKIEIHTTPFRHKVYEILSTIGYGKTLTYGDIAKILIDKNKLKAMSSQAVGNAVGHNPICIIIPCHRVIKSDGSIGRFASGPGLKEFLLSLERSNMEKNNSINGRKSKQGKIT